ncbi:MAG: conjugal transfer protein TraX [Bifidobacteriaceae bacterium]|jgi:hypothetical protein|nr:conjugal transfer protein TraX [Bifidobacteriaceae bacterium]
MTKPRRGITATGLKWVAIFAMLVDHVAWKASLPQGAEFSAHLVGRMAMPIMCFLVAEGYRHSRDRARYARRLIAFGVISQAAFNYYWSGDPTRMAVGPESVNVIFDLLLGLCALWAIRSGLGAAAKTALVALCLVGAAACDWFLFGPLWVLAFGLSNQFKRQAVWFAAVSAAMVATGLALSGDLLRLWNFGVFAVLPLLAAYNGDRSPAGAPGWLTNKWLFYVFYPAHLAVIGFVFHQVWG